MGGIQEIAGRFVLGEVVEKRPGATVYRATDKVLGGREVCVKLFHDNTHGKEDLVKSYEEEVAKLRQASHPALVPIIAGGIEQETPYLAMEYIPSTTLRELMKGHDGPLELEASIQFASELAQAAQEIHEQGLIHGHIDSRAILFKGEEPRLAGYVPKAIDQLQKNQTSAGRMVAEAYYSAPEQLNASATVDHRVDIYALSLILFEMVTGQRPFNASNPLQAAMQRLQENPPAPRSLNPKISPLLEAAILKGLQRDPKNRFQKLSEFIEALQATSGVAKNPFHAMAQQTANSSEPSVNSTIAVSISSDAIREMLGRQAATPPSAPQPVADATATAIGMKALDSQPASLMITSGNHRGKKYQMTKGQLMVGSDPTCDVVITDKGVPPRYALVFNKGGSHFVAPLSPQQVVVNQEPIKGEERELVRGDVISVGSSSIRFIAPGEVFTLKDDAADRVLDRPKSRASTYLLAGAITTVILAGGAFTLYEQQLDAKNAAQKRAQQMKAAEREKVIIKLKAEGDEFLKSGALIEPIGANAQEKFREILEFNPDDKYAKRRLDEIAERTSQLREDAERRKLLQARLLELKRDAASYFEQKQYLSPPGRNARELYQEVLKIDSNDAEAKKRIADIDRIMSDYLGQVREMMAQAESFRASGNFIEPAGQNAFEIIKRVLEVDPGNLKAKEMILEMAAQSVYNGDRAKRDAKADVVRRSYLTARALGADPAYIEQRMQGLELIEKSRSRTVILNLSNEKKREIPKSTGNYLDSAEIERRISNLELNSQLQGSRSDRSVIEMK